MRYLIDKSKSCKGFTLIELMAVIAIIGVLTAVALPAYLNYTKRSRQTKAIGELMMIKAASEKYFVENGTYTTTLSQLRGYASAGTAGVFTPDIYYRYQITPGGTVLAQGDLNQDGIFCDGWEVAMTDIMAKPSQYSIPACPADSEGISFSFLDIF